MKLSITSNFQVELPDEANTLALSSASGMMDGGELLHLAATLAAYPWDAGGIIVEIGAYCGGTTVFMAGILGLLGRRVPILSIDPFERFTPDPLNAQGVYQAYIENIQTHGVTDICLPLAAFSADAAAVVADNIGVLVVDGGHEYPAVSKDLQLYGQKILPGGFMFIDDYGPAYPDVIRAVDEYFATARFTVLLKGYFVIARRQPEAVKEPPKRPAGKRKR